MEDLAFYEISFKDCSNPCCLTDIDTYDVVYINQAMDDLLKLKENKIETKDKKCYELVYGLSAPCKFCPNKEISTHTYTEKRVYNKRLDKYFRVNNLLIEKGDRRLNLCKYYVVSSMSNEKLYSYEDSLIAFNKILNQGKINNIIQSCLKLLGRFYHSKKVYFYEIDKEKNTLERLSLWDRDNNSAIVANNILDPNQLAYLLDRLSSKNKSGIVGLDELLTFYTDDQINIKAVEKLDYTNAVFYPIRNKDTYVTGFIGLEGKFILEDDYRLLATIANYIEQSFYHPDSKYVNELKQMSDVDLLTGCHPRGKFVAQLAVYTRHQPENIGVVFANVNGLRKTNEILGTDHGDKLIRNSCKILNKHFKEPIFRISGDEFVCFVENITENLFKLRMSDLYKELFESGVHSFAVGASWKDICTDMSKMIAETDLLMHANKQEFYHTTQALDNEVRDNVQHELLKAIENEEFIIFLQPQFALDNITLIGAEALTRRYNRKENRMICSDEFISLYENNFIIHHVDVFVFERICQLIDEWQLEEKGINVAVNLSRVTLQEPDIVDTFKEICAKYNVPHHCITIEVTEKVGLVVDDAPSPLVNNLVKEGFKLALDDFGCAYSNIITLAQVHFDEVKIDKSLIENLIANESNRIVVENVITMSNSLDGAMTIAEGIETQEQVDLLKKYGCFAAQGFFFSDAIPQTEFYEKYILPLK